MQYQMPVTLEDVVALRGYPVSEELLVAAIAGVVELFQAQGKTLEQLKDHLMQPDQWLDDQQRLWLANLAADAWALIRSTKSEE
jgi:hypothetical protein